MGRYMVKGRLCQTEHIWFENLANDFRTTADRVIVHGVRQSNSAFECCFNNEKKQLSLVSELGGGKDEIIKTLTKTIRNEINRCIREKVGVKIYTSDDVLKDKRILERVGETYSAMYLEKGMGKVILPIKEFLTYAAQRNFYLTAAIIDGQEVVYHAYVTEGENTRLLISCSEFRSADKDLRNAIGRANKYLHWEDMMYFKDLGVKNYDWGGVASFENPNGIDKFKMGFGGTPIEYYIITYTFSWKARLTALIRKIIRI